MTPVTYSLAYKSMGRQFTQSDLSLRYQLRRVWWFSKQLTFLRRSKSRTKPASTAKPPLQNSRHQKLNITSTSITMEIRLKFRSFLNKFRSPKNIKKLVDGISKSCPPTTKKRPPFRSFKELPRHRHIDIIAASECAEINMPSLCTLGRLPPELRQVIHGLVAQDSGNIPFSEQYSQSGPPALMLVSKQLREEYKMAHEKNAWPTILCYCLD